MKFLWIVPQPFYTPRGTPMSLRRLLEVVAARGHQVDVVTYPIGEDITLPPGVRVFRAARVPLIRRVPIGPSVRKIALDIVLWLRAARALRNCGAAGYDALHGVEEGGWIAAGLAASFGVPFVYDMDSNLEQQVRESRNLVFRCVAPLVGWIDRMVVGRALAVLTVCGTLSETVRAEAPSKAVFQIEDAPNVLVSGEDPGAAGRLRRRFDLLSGALVIYTGNLEAYQGVDLLVEAAPAVLAGHPDTVFVIAGGELDQIKRLRRLVPARFASRVVFVGHRPENEMVDFLMGADVLVSPRSSGTNTPLKLYSYLMAGRALVVTNRVVHTQVLTGEHAMLAEPTPEGLASALGLLLGDSARRAELGGSARRLGEEFGLAAFGAKTDGFLTGIADLLSTRPDGM